MVFLQFEGVCDGLCGIDIDDVGFLTVGVFIICAVKLLFCNLWRKYWNYRVFLSVPYQPSLLFRHLFNLICREQIVINLICQEQIIILLTLL